MDGLKRKKQPGKGPQNPRKVKEHSQLQAKRVHPTAGKELELLVIKHSAIEKIVEIPSEVECKVPHYTKQCRDSDSPTGSSLDSNGESSCAKQQRRPMIQKEQTNLVGWMEDCQRVPVRSRAWDLFK